VALVLKELCQQGAGGTGAEDEDAHAPKTLSQTA
jgi:hypothetical protein